MSEHQNEQVNDSDLRDPHWDWSPLIEDERRQLESTGAAFAQGVLDAWAGDRPVVGRIRRRWTSLAAGIAAAAIIAVVVWLGQSDRGAERNTAIVQEPVDQAPMVEATCPTTALFTGVRDITTPSTDLRERLSSVMSKLSLEAKAQQKQREAQRMTVQAGVALQQVDMEPLRRIVWPREESE